MKIKAELTIGRDNHDTMSIRVVDQTSRKEFLSIEMSPHDLMMVLTGRAYTEVDAEVRGLEYVGKKKVSEQRSIICPFPHATKTAMVEWLAEHGKEPGWIVDTYLGSQSSRGKTTNEGVTLNYRVYKYVDVEESK